jgi:hypothetical protein
MLRGNSRIVVLLAIAIGLSTGCGSVGGLVPVEGKVTLDNRPLENATVMFTPTKANGPGPFVGTTDAQGHFTLGQLEGSRSGAVVGDYSVFIATVKSDSKEASPQVKKEIVPTEYRSGSKKYVVPSGGTKDANFDMKSR